MVGKTGSRRDFVRAGAVVAGSGLVLAGCGDGEDAQAISPKKDPRYRPKDCGFGRARINVCYAPYRVEKSDARMYLPKGYDEGVAVRKGPQRDAPIIYKYGEPIVMRMGGIYGRVSDRDGGVANDCPAPPMRTGAGPGGGFVWGYPTASSGTYNKGGWIPARVGGAVYTAPYDAYDHVICGPADLDFDCRSGTKGIESKYKSECGKSARPDEPGYQCGGHSKVGWGTCGKPTRMEVGIYRDPNEANLLTSLSHERYNLKYEADGTTTFWLVPGDIVARYCYKCTTRNPDDRCPEEEKRDDKSCCRSYSCVTVIKAAHVPRGVGGWVNSSVLRREGTAGPEIAKAKRELGGTLNGY
jgi:hypothetical protein